MKSFKKHISENKTIYLTFLSIGAMLCGLIIAEVLLLLNIVLPFISFIICASVPALGILALTATTVENI